MKNTDIKLTYLSDLNRSDKRNGNDSWEIRTDPDYNRQKDKDLIFDTIENINWDEESKYHNATYGRNNYIKSKNFDPAMDNCMSKRSNEPEGTILNPDSHPADWELSDIGKEYYKGEIKRTKSLLLSLAEDKDIG